VNEQPLTPPELELVDLYERLSALLRDHREELAPFAERNAIKALACLWQIANGLDRNPGQLYELGG
jgi:hypothetical protein